MKQLHIVFLTGCLLIFAGCQPTTWQPTTTLEFPTLPIIHTPEATATVSTPPGSTLFPDSRIVLALTLVKNLNMRAGPGTSFKITGTFPQNTEVAILGQSPGGEWLLTETSNHAPGWMLRYMLAYEISLDTLPVIHPPFTQVIHGSVRDLSGTPISQVKIQARQSGSSDTPLITEAISNDEGQYFLFFPEKTTGKFILSVTDIHCDSRIMDNNCKYTGHFENEGVVTVNVPVFESVNFIYRP